MNVSIGLEWAWKEGAVAYLKTLSKRWSEGAEANHDTYKSAWIV